MLYEVITLREADRRAAHLLGARVGRHDQDNVPEVGLAAIVVRQRAVIHDLQQQVEDLSYNFV